MDGTCQADRQRTVGEPEQREFFTVEPEHRQHERQRVVEFDATEEFNGPIHRFEIHKSTPLGLVYPQNVHFSVVDVDARIAQTGHTFNLSACSHEPVFVTSELKWWKQKCMLPPAFKVFPGDVDVQVHRQHTSGRSYLQASEITGLPSPPPHESLASYSSSNWSESNSKNGKPYPLAEIKYKGWQGLTSLSISLTLYNITPSMHYHHDYYHALTEDIDSAPAIRSQYTLSRIGWKREYIIRPGNYRWRAPSISEKNQILCTSAVDDTASPTGHGNLILEDSEAKVVAVYKQRRDYEILGLLTILTNQVSGSRNGEERDEQDGKITAAAVVSSCLAVVVYERVGWQNLLGR